MQQVMLAAAALFQGCANDDPAGGMDPVGPVQGVYVEEYK
jgi:hypothetical protein